MMIRNLIVSASLAACGTSASAEVKSSSPFGFAIENKAVVKAAPDQVFQALGRVSGWWDSRHTYSGKAENLSLGLKAGECFCEQLPGGGSAEHMRVVLSQPGQLLRLQGGLGPLQAEGAAGTMTFALKAVPGGSEITHSYIVGGYLRPGGDKLAPAVDKVLAQQLTGLVRHLDDRSAKSGR